MAALRIFRDDDLPGPKNRKHDVVAGIGCVLPGAQFDHPTDHYRHYPSVKQIIKPQHDKVTALAAQISHRGSTNARLIALSISPFPAAMKLFNCDQPNQIYFISFGSFGIDKFRTKRHLLKI